MKKTMLSKLFALAMALLLSAGALPVSALAGEAELVPGLDTVGQPELADPRSLPSLEEAVKMAGRLKSRYHLPYYWEVYIDRFGNLWGVGVSYGPDEKPAFKGLILRDVVETAQSYNGDTALFALLENGQVWVMGHVGAVGLGGYYDAYSGTPMLVAEGIRSISAESDDLMALDEQGVLWCYSHTDGRETPFGPTRRRMLDQVEQVASGFCRTAALRTDGSVWFWGEDGYGCDQKIVDNYLHDRPRPVSQLMGSEKRIISIGMENENGWAIDADGGLWCWGSNEYGQIGNNNVCDSFTSIPQYGGGEHRIGGMEQPVRVIERDVISAAPGMAVLRDGRVLRWSCEQAFLGEGLEVTSPVPVLTEEQRMVAGKVSITEDGCLRTLLYGHGTPVLLRDFLPQSEQPETDAKAVIQEVTQEGGYAVIHAVSSNGEALEYGVGRKDVQLLSADPILWQDSNRFLLEPGDYTFYARVRSTFDAAAHSAGSPVEAAFTVPGPMYIRVGIEYAQVYTTGALTGEENWSCVLAGYDRNGKMVGSDLRKVARNSFRGDQYVAETRIVNWKNLETVRAFVVDNDTGMPVFAAAELTV